MGCFVGVKMVLTFSNYAATAPQICHHQPLVAAADGPQILMGKTPLTGTARTPTASLSVVPHPVEERQLR